jgi:hypothetical protein
MSEELKGERAEFDEWASAEGINTCRSTHSDSYAFPAARASWKAWQARAAQPPAAEGAVIQAAKVVMREALDSVCVHPCDEHNDDVRANCLSENMQALYHVLRTAPSSSASERTADEAGGASNDFEKALWELVDEARKWEKAYLDGARIYESLHHEKTDVEQTIRMIVNRFAPKQAEDAGEDEAVGIADEMPGTRGGFTMATFRASDVPAGSSLYTRPASAQPPAEAQPVAQVPKDRFEFEQHGATYAVCGDRAAIKALVKWREDQRKIVEGALRNAPQASVANEKKQELTDEEILKVAECWMKEPGFFEFEPNDFYSCVRALLSRAKGE